MQPSDEEILPLPSSASLSEDDALSDEDAAAEGVEMDSIASDVELDPQEIIDRQGWGTSRKDYYDADIIETEADALEEEEEALRLQKKQLQGMTAADFGFDENEWLDSGKADQDDDDDHNRVVQEVLPQVEITDDMPVEERNRILAFRYPEFEPLSREFLALQGAYEKSCADVVAAQRLLENQKANIEDARMPRAVARWAALTTYLAALCMYFAILTSGPMDAEGRRTCKTPTELRSHPIMESIMQSRTTWYKVKDLEISDQPEQAQVNGNDKHVMVEAAEKAHVPEPKQRPNSKTTEKRKSRKSKAQVQAEAALAKAEALRAERLSKTEADLAKLAQKLSARKSISGASDYAQSTASPSYNLEADDSDFGEEPFSNGQDTDRRKKSLQFYTSQIAQKANKRAAARDAGDTDIPYRERLKDRQARLTAQAEACGRKKADVLGDSSADEDDARVAAEMRREANGRGDGASGDEEDYYATIASQTAARKAQKTKNREAALESANAQVVRGKEKLGPDGKRGITYAIEKNKGLTPKRSKSVRNPRLKKRLKYESKLKKLGSIRQVYRGPEGKRGPYGGEVTGIKTGLVRSIKL